MGFRLLANIATGTRDKRTVAVFATALLRLVVASNRIEMRRARAAGTPYPPLYKSPIVYNREPWAGRIEEFADCKTVLKRGWGDCDDLCAYRLAELLEGGEQQARPCSRHVVASAKCGQCRPGADIRIYWRRRPGSPMHVEVRRANGTIEDPSRFLGL